MQVDVHSVSPRKHRKWEGHTFWAGGKYPWVWVKKGQNVTCHCSVGWFTSAREETQCCVVFLAGVAFTNFSVSLAITSPGCWSQDLAAVSSLSTGQNRLEYRRMKQTQAVTQPQLFFPHKQTTQNKTFLFLVLDGHAHTSQGFDLYILRESWLFSSMAGKIVVTLLIWLRIGQDGIQQLRVRRGRWAAPGFLAPWLIWMPRRISWYDDIVFVYRRHIPKAPSNAAAKCVLPFLKPRRMQWVDPAWTKLSACRISTCDLLTTGGSLTLFGRLLPNTTSNCVAGSLCAHRAPLPVRPSPLTLCAKRSSLYLLIGDIIILHVEGLMLTAACCACMPALLAPGSERSKSFPSMCLDIIYEFIFQV